MMKHNHNDKDIFQAYQAGDTEASRDLHLLRSREMNSINHEEQHNTSGHLKSIVYGGLDGIMTSFATITSVAGGGLPHVVVLILGVSHLFADGLSMGLGDTLSTKAEHEYYFTERKREEWEMSNHMYGETKEMIDLLSNKYGVSLTDSTNIITMLSKYPSAFLELMMLIELELLPIEKSSPYWNGLVTMISFAGFGALPLIPYMLGYFGLPLQDHTQFPVACVVTLISLFVLGMVKTALVGIQNTWRKLKGGLEMATLGLTVALLGYFISAYVGYLTGTKDMEI